MRVRTLLALITFGQFWSRCWIALRALRAGHVEELSVSIAPVVLGAGKRLFDDFEQPMTLEHVSLLQSPFPTYITYRVVR